MPVICACGDSTPVKAPATDSAQLVKEYSYRVLAKYPHDISAFTQGLTFDAGKLYEGTGLYGQSALRQINVADGAVIQEIQLGREYFGEGVAVLDGEIFQLTWKNNTALIYDQAAFTFSRQVSYLTEGWGLTHNGSELILSSGESRLYFIAPGTFSEVKRIEVTRDDQPQALLNELEFISGAVYANVWQTDTVVLIDPASGRVTGAIDFSGLLSPDERKNADVLNGIAYDHDKQRLYVTGKLWPWLFEVEIE